SWSERRIRYWWLALVRADWTALVFTRNSSSNTTWSLCLNLGIMNQVWSIVFLQEESLKLSRLDLGSGEPSLAIMFLQTALQNDDLVSYFSVLSASSSALKGRAIV